MGSYCLNSCDLRSLIGKYVFDISVSGESMTANLWVVVRVGKDGFGKRLIFSYETEQEAYCDLYRRMNEACASLNVKRNPPKPEQIKPLIQTYGKFKQQKPCFLL